jgi:hypothetical protein
MAADTLHDHKPKNAQVAFKVTSLKLNQVNIYLEINIWAKKIEVDLSNQYNQEYCRE